MSYLIRSASLTNYVEVARSVGLDPYQQLRTAGIGQSALLYPDTKIPAAAVGRLLEASAQAAGIDDLGLRMAETRQLSNLGPLAFVVREEPTLRRALQAMTHYLRLQNEALSMRIEETGGHGDHPRRRHRWVLGFGAPGKRTRAGGAVPDIAHVSRRRLEAAQRLCFRMQRRPALPPTSAYLAPTSNSARNSTVSSASAPISMRPSRPTMSGMAPFVRNYLDAMLAQSQATMGEQIRQWVTIMLPMAECSIERAAAHLGVDRRTVHRHLARNGESFSTIVETVRAELIMRYVGSRDRPLSQVATLLGFSSSSAFSRWFRSRFGCSVSQWRRQHH